MKKKIEIVITSLILFSAVFYAVNYNFDNFKRKTVLADQKLPSEWLEKYQIAVVSDNDLVADVDGDGLSLEKEYEYQTNPLESDTDNDGYNDGREIQNGYSPVGEGKMDYDNDNLPDKWEKENGLDLNLNDYGEDSDGDGLLNYQEFEYLTKPMNKDTDGDGKSDSEEINQGYDPSQAGDIRPTYVLKIKKIDVSAPIIFTESFVEGDMLEDLKKGVIHYSKTSVPGQIGNMVISGHSSNYAWVKGDYNYVFQSLNNLEVGDEIVAEVTYGNGKKFEYVYKVFNKGVRKPDDADIFQETTDKQITLVTCWPLGTNLNRMVIKAKI